MQAVVTNGADVHFLLENGKMFVPNCGIVGLSPSGGLHGGYDETYYLPDECVEEEYADITARQAVEIADHMIAEWTKFREKWKAKT